MHTSLKGGEHVVLNFACQRVIFVCYEFQNGFCRVFGLFDFQHKQPNKPACWTLDVAGHLVPLQL